MSLGNKIKTCLIHICSRILDQLDLTVGGTECKMFNYTCNNPREMYHQENGKRRQGYVSIRVFHLFGGVHQLGNPTHKGKCD